MVIMTKPKRTLAELDALIRRTKKFLAQIREERRELIKAQRRAMPKKQPGAKPIDKDIIELAKKLAQRKSLTEVALQLNVSLRTLYNKGISRAAIDAEKAKKATENRTEPTPTSHRNCAENHRECTENTRRN